MTPSDFIAIIAAGFSALSLIVSIWAAYKATKLGNYQLRLSNRTELHTMLLEIDREMLHDPSLAVMFKTSSRFTSSSTSPIDIDKQDVYVTMYLNLFELSFAQFKELKGLTPAEEEVSEAWDRFILSFFEDCTRAREVWARYRATYYSSFRDYIDDLIREADNVERLAQVEASELVSKVVRSEIR